MAIKDWFKVKPKRKKAECSVLLDHIGDVELIKGLMEFVDDKNNWLLSYGDGSKLCSVVIPASLKVRFMKGKRLFYVGEGKVIGLPMEEEERIEFSQDLLSSFIQQHSAVELVNSVNPPSAFNWKMFAVIGIIAVLAILGFRAMSCGNDEQQAQEQEQQLTPEEQAEYEGWE